MALQLPPETEIRLRERASRDGISIDELVNGFLEPEPPIRTHKPVMEETPEETHARVMAQLAKRQAKYGLPVPQGGFKTLAQLFAEWKEEDAQLTDEEREAERHFWDDYERERPNRPLQI